MRRFFQFLKKNLALKRLWLLILFPLGLLLTGFAAAWPDFAEGWARTVYRLSLIHILFTREERPLLDVNFLAAYVKA